MPIVGVPTTRVASISSVRVWSFIVSRLDLFKYELLDGKQEKTNALRKGKSIERWWFSRCQSVAWHGAEWMKEHWESPIASANVLSQGKKEINEILHSSFWVCVFSFHNGRGWLKVAREFFEIQDWIDNWETDLYRTDLIMQSFLTLTLLWSNEFLAQEPQKNFSKRASISKFRWMSFHQAISRLFHSSRFIELDHWPILIRRMVNGFADGIHLMDTGARLAHNISAKRFSFPVGNSFSITSASCWGEAEREGKNDWKYSWMCTFCVMWKFMRLCQVLVI